MLNLKGYAMHIFLMAILSFTFASMSFAADTKHYDYPELLVSPRASERLQREAKQEEHNSWTSHIPIQTSALTTFFAATMVAGDKADREKFPGDKGDEKDAGVKNAATFG